MKIRKVLYIVVGCIGVGLGAVGAVLPLLPAFPFLLLATFCFAKSSEKLHQWFTGTKLYKNNLESYVKGKGMTWKTKIRIMIMVTLLMSIGFIMMSRVPVGRIVLTCVWVFHIIYFIFGVKTLKEGTKEPLYSWSRKLVIEGLHCENCAKCLECAFCERGNMKAEVNLENETATVYAEEPVKDEVIQQIVHKAGYAVIQML